ncbi:S8 family serine peptidase [Actinomadura rupiterrae]|uniref:S8 family serine peptidase n=1 Tax=Actinomadura rupiterrae TaxID=559627 RepID=UPI0020A56920|nr:S8 family serine peptidase [Actinomadura rupiterrae]MCP2336472.1 hypothetical protein [Actinomadura rupiterrae]
MLTRVLGAGLASALVLVLAPPLASAAHADAGGEVKRSVNDLSDAAADGHGEGVKVALLSDGVEDVFGGGGRHVEPEKDFVGLSKPDRRYGTLIASMLVGGRADMEYGWLSIDGYVRNARLMPVRVMAGGKEPGFRKWGYYTGKPAKALADGIRYAADKGAEVIAITDPGGWDGKGIVGAAVTYAQSKNALVIAPTGSHDADDVQSIAALPGVLGVGVVDEDGDRYGKFSGATSAIQLVAYGDKTPGIGDDGTANWTFWGVGPAVGFVASAAVLVRSTFPKLTPAQVVEALTSSARNPKGHYTTEHGFGFVNASGALTKAAALAKRPPLAETAEPTVADASHFGGKTSARIRAVPLPLPWFGGFGALVAVGVIAIAAALWLLVRRRPALAAGPVQPALPVDALTDGTALPAAPAEAVANAVPGEVPGEAAGEVAGEAAGERVLPALSADEEAREPVIPAVPADEAMGESAVPAAPADEVAGEPVGPSRPASEGVGPGAEG